LEAKASKAPLGKAKQSREITKEKIRAGTRKRRDMRYGVSAEKPKGRKNQ
jgi:hypothetical protein